MTDQLEPARAAAPARPVMMTIDDDPRVLRAIERDLRGRYGREYRVVRAESGEAGLVALDELQRRGEPVALFLIDHRMPQMNGIDFLEQARERAPTAKRVLLTAYADTEAAIRAINTVKLDHYLLKPWDPPEEQLFPVLDDLLEDWKAGFRPPYRGLRLIGHRWSPATHDIREFLTRNQIPYRWLDVERDDEARQAVALTANGEAIGPNGAGPRLPVLLFGDGTMVQAPTLPEVAATVGLQSRAQLPFYDLVIAGGGPAGLAAAVYGASEGLRTVMIEKIAPGGQAGMSARIENYLGFPSGLSGGDLARRAVAQATRFGVEILTPQIVSGLRVEDPYRVISLADGTEISCLAMVIATGVFYRRLEAPGIERLTGAGVYYGGSQSEAASCAGEDVFIIGGANSAGQAAMYFARYARTVTVVVRGSGLDASMSAYLVEQLGQTPNISLAANTSVVEAHGAASLTGITLRDTRTGTTSEHPTTGLFIFIGAQPHTDWLDGLIERDPGGYIRTGPDLERDQRGRWRRWPLERDPFLLESCVPGVFVAGDVRHASIKRVASGVGEGSIAVSFVHQYLAESKV